MIVKIDVSDWNRFVSNNELILFLNMCRLVDQDGYASVSIETLRKVSRLKGPVVKKALKTLTAQSDIIDIKVNKDEVEYQLKAMRRFISGIQKEVKQPKKVLSIDEQVFNNRMNEKYPRIMRLQKPLTLADWVYLINIYEVQELKDIMIAMENWKPLLQKSISAKHTIMAWIRRRRNQNF